MDYDFRNYTVFVKIKWIIERMNIYATHFILSGSLSLSLSEHLVSFTLFKLYSFLSKYHFNRIKYIIESYCVILL